VLSDIWHDLLANIPAQMLTEKISRNFKSVSKSIENFARLSGLSIGSVSPNGFKGYGSNLLHAGRAMSDKWVSFVELVNSICDIGISPHIQAIEADLESLATAVQVINRCYKSQRFKTDIAGTILSELYACAKLWRSRIRRITAITKVPRRISPIMCIFQAKVKEMSAKTTILFDKWLPMYSRRSEILCSRAIIMGDIARINNTIQSIDQFERLTGRLKSEILEFNSELAIVHSSLNVPFGIDLEIITAPPMPIDEMEC
jgi:hypothetical protein